MSSPETPEIIQWIVDTRDLWPAATKTAQLEQEAPEYLALLTAEERAAVLKYYFVRDAKMSLASQLLKHYVVSRATGLPWAATALARGVNQKPIFLAADGVSQPVHFNVSHQAGIVAVAAVSGYAGGRADVGVDVVCVSERRDRDHQLIRTQGWPAFVDMHADVFGRSETTSLKQALSGAPPASDPARVDAALRRFYALWCLREAYVKMTGEALLASWLHDLEFQGFRATEPAAEEEAAGLVQRADDPAATVIRTNEVLLHGQKVDDANICLRSLGRDYMTATAVRTPARKEDALGWQLGPFETIDLERILRHAESAK